MTIQLNFKPDHYDNYVWTRLLRSQNQFVDNGKPKLLVIGDSMAADFVNVLGESGHSEKFDMVTRAIGHGSKSVFLVSTETYEQYLPVKIEKFKKQHEAVMSGPLLDQADSVILSSFWESWDIELINSTVKYLKGRGGQQIAVVGRKDQSVNGIKFNAKFAYRKSAHRLRTPVAKSAKKYNAEIDQLSEDFLFVDVLDSFCDENGYQRVTDQGYLIIYDNNHLSPRGAKFIGDQVKESPWMNSLLHKI